MALSQNEIFNLAKSAGLNESRARVAASVAMAESGGNPNAHNSKPPDDSYGLWQINMIGAMGPSRRKTFGISANSDLYNPGVNAKAMAKISGNGGNFSAWSTYTSGAYQKYMNTELKVDQSITDRILGNIKGSFGDFLGKTPVVGDVVDTAEGVNTAVGYLGKTAVWVSNSENWIRIAYVVGGGIIAVVALASIINSTSAGKAVTDTAVSGAKLVATKGAVK